MNDGSGFCGSFFRGSGAFLLLTDLVEAECQSGDRSQEGAENLGDESVLAGKLAEALKLLDRQDGAFNEAPQRKVTVFAAAFLLFDRVLRDCHVASLLAMTHRGNAALGMVRCAELASRLSLRGRAGHAPPLLLI